MDARVISIAGQLMVTDNLVRAALDAVTPEQLRRSPGPGLAPMLWIAGHLVTFRARLVGVLGVEHPVPWTELFSTGTHYAEITAYPDAEALLAEWTTVTAALTTRLAELTADELQQAPRVRVPTPDGTLAGALYMFAFHEGYHVGQLGYLRRWLGLSPLLDR